MAGTVELKFMTNAAPVVKEVMSMAEVARVYVHCIRRYAQKRHSHCSTLRVVQLESTLTLIHSTLAAPRSSAALETAVVSPASKQVSTHAIAIAG